MICIGFLNNRDYPVISLCVSGYKYAYIHAGHDIIIIFTITTFKYNIVRVRVGRFRTSVQSLCTTHTTDVDAQ